MPANTSFGRLSARFGMRFSPMPRATRNHACSNSTSAMSAEYSTKSSQFFSIWKRVFIVAARQFIPIDYSTISIACEHCCIQKQSNSNQLSLHSPSIWLVHSNWNFYVFNIVFSQFVIIETICCRYCSLHFGSMHPQNTEKKCKFVNLFHRLEFICLRQQSN